MPTGDAAAAVQNFLQSLQGSQALQSQQSQASGQIYTTLPELLPNSTTIPVIDSATESFLDNLLSHLPPMLLLLNQEADDTSSADPSTEMKKAAIEALNPDQKKDILRRVLRSPQFSQSLGSLTQALRDGGLPTISDALKIPVANNGFIKPKGDVPLGGGDAVKAFVEGVKANVEANEKPGETDQENMQTE